MAQLNLQFSGVCLALGRDSVKRWSVQQTIKCCNEFFSSRRAVRIGGLIKNVMNVNMHSYTISMNTHVVTVHSIV